jgi:hypothetical protein
MHKPTHQPALKPKVCLSQRTTKTTEKPTDDKKHRSDNNVYVATASEVVNRKSVLLRNIVLTGKESASNPLLHIHAKRCRQLKQRQNKHEI